MEKAENLEQLIKKVAKELTAEDRVYYDLDTLQYDCMSQYFLSEYGDYLDLSDEAFNEIPEDELGGDTREEVIELRKIVDLPYWLEKPTSSEAFRWMEEFTEEHADNQKFYRAAVKALRNRHPFSGFRSALDYNGLTKQWYKFHESQVEDIVRKEISLKLEYLAYMSQKKKNEDGKEV